MGSGASAVGVKRYGPGGEGFKPRQRQAATVGPLTLGVIPRQC